MPKPNPLPSQERLQELFEYSVVTGTLYRKKGVRGFAAGSSVGCPKSEGRHLSTSVDRAKFHVHRLIWKLVTGEEPALIDHRDGDPTNNAWHNLRLATQSQNMCNHRMKSNNTSGFKGVSFNRASGRWMAMVWKDYKPHYLGLYDTPEQAHAAYVAAAERFHGDFARAH